MNCKSMSEVLKPLRMALKLFWKEKILSLKRLRESKPIRKGHKKSEELLQLSANSF